MISSFQIRKFKSCRNVDLNCGRITILIGPNSSGKSSVLQALTLLKQSLHAPALNTAGPLLNLGSFLDIVHMKDLRNRIEFGLSGKLALHGLSRDILGAEYANFEYGMVCDQNGVFSQSVGLGAANKAVNITWSRGIAINPVPAAFELSMGQFGIAVRADPTNTIGRVFNYTPTPTPSSLPPGQQDRYIEGLQAISELLLAVENAIKLTYFVPAIRGFDQTTYQLAAQPSTDFISQSGASQEASNVAANLAYHREIEDKISSWSARITGNKIMIRLVPGQKVSLESQLPQFGVNIVNDGVGANQLIFPLAQLALAPSDSVIGIEEPEIHLHPRAQSEFADLLAEVSIQENKQIILTTHSEHLLFRLLTNVTEKKLSPSDLKIYYFKKEGQEALGKELRITEKGQIEGGLPGFFEADLAEFSRYLSALSSES